MSGTTHTIASLPRISPNALHKLLSSPSSASSLAIVDVRDADYVGGHIKSSKHVPSSTLDHKAPELVRELKGKKTVVFHCMLSQQRGPGAALRYLREKERLDGADSSDAGQEVIVLEGGFQGWQEKFGDDPKVTEAYVKDLWV